MDLSEWSEEVFSLRDIVDKGLPNIVLVEGYSIDSDDHSFSKGNILHLNSIQEVRYVEARHVNDPEELVELIPVDCNRMVVLIEEVGKVFKSVKEVMEEMPRFVRTESIVVAEVEDDNNLSPFIILPGTKLEILENYLDRALKCTFRGKLMEVDIKQTASFSLIDNKNEYHVKDVVKRRRLPIVVQFIEGIREFLPTDIKDFVNNYKIFSGRYVLSSLVTKAVVIGHFKPLIRKEREILSDDKCTAFILPYDGKTMKQIEVRAPIYTNKECKKQRVSEFGVFEFRENPVSGSVLVLSENTKIKIKDSTKNVVVDESLSDSPNKSSCRTKSPIYDVIYHRCSLSEAGREYDTLEVKNQTGNRGPNYDVLHPRCDQNGTERECYSLEVKHDIGSTGPNLDVVHHRSDFSEIGHEYEEFEIKKHISNKDVMPLMSLPGASNLEPAGSPVAQSSKDKDRNTRGSTERSLLRYLNGLRKRFLRRHLSSDSQCNLKKTSAEDSKAPCLIQRQENPNCHLPKKNEAKLTYKELAKRLRIHGFFVEANICEKHKLDDWVFLTCETKELSLNLSLSVPQIFKIRKVCQGWLPAQQVSLLAVQDTTERLI